MISRKKLIPLGLIATIFTVACIFYHVYQSKNLKEARRYFEEGNLENAKTYYEEYLKTNPKNESALAEYELLKGNYKVAEELFIKVKVSDYYSIMGRGALLLNDFDNALKYYSDTIKHGSDNSNDYLEVGFIYFKLGKYEEAKGYFKKALLLDPESPKAYLGMGKTCFARLEYDEAINAYKNALKFKPDFAEAHVGIGDVYEFLDQYTDADEAYNTALKYNQEFAKAYLGLSTIRLKQQKWDESVKYFKRYEELKEKKRE